MDIKTGSRAHKLFLWALEICEIFNEKGGYACRFRQETNLCHYYRVMFLYLPLIFLAQIFVWLTVASALLFLPVYFWGYIGWGKFVGAVGLIIASIWGVVWLKNRSNNRSHKQRQGEDIFPETKANGHPSQAEILKEWFWAKKSKVCPEIRFVDEKELV